MALTFYHSGLCPRCAQARKHLASLLGDTYSRYVVEVDVLSHPFQSWKNGIRMIPALTYNTSQLSGLMLSREQIEQFLITHGLLTATSKDNH